MTRYELIKAAESILRMCDNAGIAPSEARYLPVYEDWLRLTREGHKKVWIMAYLSQQYNISEATVKRIARKMGKRVKA
jgi:hypothetical protein